MPVERAPGSVLGGRPLLCLVTDHRGDPDALAGSVAEAIAGGVDWVQLRARGVGAAAQLRWLRALRARVRAPSIRWIVNRRLDVALAAGADGVHLGFDAVGPADARRLLGPAALIGRSTHRADEAIAASAQDADYLHLAPIFDPISKPRERPCLGLDELARAAAVCPVLAQGGIQAAHVGSVIAAGAAGVAVTGAILGHDDPRAAARSLRSALDAAEPPQARQLI